MELVKISQSFWLDFNKISSFLDYFINLWNKNFLDYLNLIISFVVSTLLSKHD